MKIKELKKILESKKSDFAVFYTQDSSRISPNMLYFSGYSGIGALVVPKKQEPFLAVPEMECERAKKSVIKNVYTMEKKKFFESMQNILKRCGIQAKNIMIDKNNFTLNSYKYFKKQFKKVKISDTSQDCARLREIKTDEEVTILKKSCSYADKILQKSIKTNMFIKMENLFEAKGYSSFPSIA